MKKKQELNHNTFNILFYLKFQGRKREWRKDKLGLEWKVGDLDSDIGSSTNSIYDLLNQMTWLAPISSSVKNGSDTRLFLGSQPSLTFYPFISLSYTWLYGVLYFISNNFAMVWANKSYIREEREEIYIFKFWSLGKWGIFISTTSTS